MKVLVFASNKVGYEILKYLIKNFSKDDYTIVIIDEKNNQKISKYNNQIKKFLSLKKINYLSYEIFLKKYLNYKFDWLLNIWGGKIFTKQILKTSRYSLNIHPSLLPYAKGKDPVVWTIRNSYDAGVTLHKIVKKIDSGKIYCQKKIKYNMPISGEKLYKIIEDNSIDFFCKKWKSIRRKPTFLKKNNFNINKIYKRSDLHSDKIKNIEEKNIKRVILWLLAHDFYKNNYTAELKIKNKIYMTRLLLKEKK